MPAPTRRLRPTREAILAVVAALPFVVWIAGTHLHADFWYDEVFSLKSYGFGSLWTVLTDYSSPNNHVFFNALNWGWLRVVGVDSLESCLATPWLVRLLPFAFSVLALPYVYLAASRSGRLAGVLAVGVIATALPYCNFAAQVRGYSLSILLIASLLYHSLAYVEDGRRRDGVAILVATALVLYSIPSNLYAVIGVAAASLLLRSRTAVRAAGFVVGGVVLAVLLYSPMLRQVVDNPFVQSDAWFATATLTQRLPRALGAFAADRELFLFAATIGLAFVRDRVRLLALGVVLLFPFVSSFVRGDRPFDRVFVSLLPAFALFVGIAAAASFERLGRTRLQRDALAFGLAIYGACGLHAGLSGQRAESVRATAFGTLPQRLDCHYALGVYSPGALTELLLTARTHEPGPVRIDRGDLAAVPEYLLARGIEVEPFRADAARRGEVRYVITSRPHALLKQLRAASFRAERLGDEPRVHSVLRVSRG